ncbi:MAG TPA: DUF4252 domain-containing protein [Bryobacteraceae bacterium]|jgi:hypothetical protein|nr:DUF4252 domain-containing protein [Bryobacteraceae bacterium]
MIKLALITCLSLAPLGAQELKIPASLDRLAAKATEVVDVTMDANLLQLAGRFLSDKNPDDAQVKKLIEGLKGIYVRSFEFAKQGEYQDSDVEPVRAQLHTPAWSRIVGVRSQKSNENSEVYVKTGNGKIGGLAILVTEPKQLTIVSIEGSIDPDQLGQLGGHFGIPKIDTRKETGHGKDE